MRAASAPRRVVVTGIGAVSGPGRGVEALWSALVRPTDGPVVPTLDWFDASDWFEHRDRRRTDQHIQFAVAAATEAVAVAGMPDVDPFRRAVVFGNGWGGTATIAREVRQFDADPRAVSGVSAPMVAIGAVASWLARRFECRGEVWSLGAACAGGAASIATAARMLADGHCDVAIAGGSEGDPEPWVSAAFENLRICEHGIVRPFDVRRAGFAQAGGAGAVLLEPLEQAEARGARVLAEVLGAVVTNDAGNFLAPAVEGAERTMRLALHDAELDPAHIVAINAHGTGTEVNDRVESQAIVGVFGPSGPMVTSVKGRIGHVISGAGALEAVAVVHSFATALVPPVAVDFESDPEIAADVVSGAPRPLPDGPVLSNSFGMGGHNACLVLAPPGWLDRSAARG